MGLSTADLEAGMRSLITLAHNSNSLILALSAWLAMHGVERNDVTHRLLDTRTRPVPYPEATELDVDEGLPLLRRRGELWAHPDGVPVRIAAANAWVVPQRMPADVVELIRQVPLGLVLQPHGMRRVPGVSRWSRVPRLVVRLSARLLVGGVPWALTDEVIDQAIVEHVLRGSAIPPSSVA
ncbi:hypothetical protein Lesp02_72950 [Lentzea sp. NBRC 105346]|uniref:hypothetical protein n=1 Tax=Lentzea sp. NBRC 105346 TaxID=3032205 RepID=UPI0024A00B49|nr:hypothetical protein [Lentzea sp. NBRC 105346]GLZ35108.1 hypothetical protein Lesp02_72950 [Lentzea sp. NBRC 105346]